MKKMRSRSMACAEQPIRSDKTSPRRGAARSRVSTFVAPSQSFRTTIFAADASADKSRPQPAKTDANTAVSILHPEWIKATRILWTIFCSCMPGMFQRILEVLAEFDYFSAGVRAGLRTVIVVPHGNGREQNAAMRVWAKVTLRPKLPRVAAITPSTSGCFRRSSAI
jgi:hypothetical protein